MLLSFALPGPSDSPVQRLLCVLWGVKGLRTFVAWQIPGKETSKQHALKHFVQARYGVDAHLVVFGFQPFHIVLGDVHLFEAQLLGFGNPRLDSAYGPYLAPQTNLSREGY